MQGDLAQHQRCKDCSCMAVLFKVAVEGRTDAYLLEVLLTLRAAGQGALRAGAALPGVLPGRLVVRIAEREVPQRAP